MQYQTRKPRKRFPAVTSHDCQATLTVVRVKQCRVSQQVFEVSPISSQRARSRPRCCAAAERITFSKQAPLHFRSATPSIACNRRARASRHSVASAVRWRTVKLAFQV